MVVAHVRVMVSGCHSCESYGKWLCHCGEDYWKISHSCIFIFQQQRFFTFIVMGMCGDVIVIWHGKILSSFYHSPGICHIGINC